MEKLKITARVNDISTIEINGKTIDGFWDLGYEWEYLSNTGTLQKILKLLNIDYEWKLLPLEKDGEDA